ncbi:MAG: ACP S-malonyltransferase [Actinomycetia bacterium]|nr:ACP S-malonyltransferase [Actinomycetes bacterium]
MGGLLILCPGQGSQAPGMAEYLWDHPVARETFAEAGDTLGWDVGELCRHGSMEELTRTDRTQLAILTCSVAVWRVLADREATCAVAAGHSLGEYSALVATGHMAFADALRVVDVRGRGMQTCAERRGGTMAAIIGLESGIVEEICACIPEVWVANYNSPGQVVISGSIEGVRAAGERAGTEGARRVLPLPVSGAFHTPFMDGAAEALAEALAGVRFAAGRARFFSTTELRYPEPGELAHVLSRQLMSPVRFTQSMEMLLGGADAPDRGLEVGPGEVLTGLVKRIRRDLPMAATGDADALQKALAAEAETRRPR